MPKYLSRADLERIGAAVVSQYYQAVPQTGTMPERVDPVLLAKVVMGLEVSYLPLSGDGSILGLASFQDTVLELYDKNGRPYQVELTGRDIVIDSALLDAGNAGRHNFTAAHELAHHVLVRLYPENYQDRLSCRKHVLYRDSSKQLDWEEWQANVMAASIIMPPQTLRYCMYLFGLESALGGGPACREREFERFCDIAAYLGVSKKALAISNQRGLIQGFISSRPEFGGWEVSEFCDDGWSGKNFERPGFLGMMEQVKQGQVHCIVVKDLSRFGRDYLVVGNYISRVFPFLGVRFIAVNDGFDSSRPQDIDSLDTSFKTLIYDLYSRELSAKVKNAKRMRAEKGLFLSPFAPYGYVKDPEDKNRLLVDKEAADIVRKIFLLASDGVKPVEIAAMLNRDGVPTPMLHKRAAGCSRDRWPSIHEGNFWTRGHIFKILRDERYIGKCVYGKRERDMVGNWHTVKRSRADWVVVDETHEGVVSKELFQKAASRMKEYKEFIPCASERNPLRKKVICGTCGYAMSLSNTKNAKYRCRTSQLEAGFDCSSNGILQADIHEMVVTLIRTYAAYAVSLEHLLLLQKERIQAEKKQARRELAVLQSRKGQLEKSLQDLYEKLIDGTIDRETYLSQKASNRTQMEELTEKMERLEQPLQTSTEQGGAFIEKYREYTELETLTSEIANDVVKRVTVYKDGGIEIKLALRDELEKLLSCFETIDGVS